MKYLIALLFLLSTQLSAVERPMTINMIDDPDFGKLGIVSAVQAVNEGLIFEWTEDFINWNFLADISPYIVEQWWSVSIPGNWLSGRFFVRARGYTNNLRAAAPKHNNYTLFWPAVKIKVIRKLIMPPMPPGMKLPVQKNVRLLNNTKKGAELLKGGK